jgi:hypothetical protein
LVIKSKAPSADNSKMTRMLGTIALLVAMGACGAALYTHVRADGLSTVVNRLGFRASGGEIAADELLSAATILQTDHNAYGTYRRSNLASFKSMTLVYATDSGYCLQDAKAGKIFHLVGPGGVPLDGLC